MTNKSSTPKYKTDCVGQCHRLKGYCTGCGRASDEIFDWIILTPQEKEKILKTLRKDL